MITKYKRGKEARGLTNTTFGTFYHIILSFSLPSAPMILIIQKKNSFFIQSLNSCYMLVFPLPTGISRVNLLKFSQQ